MLELVGEKGELSVTASNSLKLSISQNVSNEPIDASADEVLYDKPDQRTQTVAFSPFHYAKNTLIVKVLDGSVESIESEKLIKDIENRELSLWSKSKASPMRNAAITWPDPTNSGKFIVVDSSREELLVKKSRVPASSVSMASKSGIGDETFWRGLRLCKRWLFSVPPSVTPVQVFTQWRENLMDKRGDQAQ